MMSNFGMEDPFKDDPFFNGSGMFGSGGIDKIMNQMQKRMGDMQRGFGGPMIESGPNSRF
jgi:hypothetical protein